MLVSSSDGLAREGLVATILVMADMLAGCRFVVGWEQRRDLGSSLSKRSFVANCANCLANVLG